VAESKYEPQRKHLREKYARFPLDFKPETLEDFKTICAEQGTNPTREIKKFVGEYIEKNKKLSKKG